MKIEFTNTGMVLATGTDFTYTPGFHSLIATTAWAVRKYFDKKRVDDLTECLYMIDKESFFFMQPSIMLLNQYQTVLINEPDNDKLHKLLSHFTYKEQRMVAEALMMVEYNLYAPALKYMNKALSKGSSTLLEDAISKYQQLTADLSATNDKWFKLIEEKELYSGDKTKANKDKYDPAIRRREMEIKKQMEEIKEVSE